MVSVLMVAHQAERLLVGAIESVLSQDWQDLELIVSDDGGFSNLEEISRRYEDPRLRININPVRLGEYKNRNKVLSMARGRYVYYLDADDRIHDGGLGHAMRYALQFPDAYQIVVAPRCHDVQLPTILGPRQYYLNILFGPAVLGLNFTEVMFSRFALRAIGGLPTEYRTGDSIVQLMVAELGSTLLIPGEIGWWRRHEGQASETVLSEHIEAREWFHYLRDALARERLDLRVDEAALARVRITGSYIRMAAHLAKAGQIRAAADWIRHGNLALGDLVCVFRSAPRSSRLLLGG
jgi:glycosyltransferase involved in cell wall biosynthesis